VRLLCCNTRAVSFRGRRRRARYLHRRWPHPGLGQYFPGVRGTEPWDQCAVFGRPGQRRSPLLLRGPAQPPHAENVVMETTYGDRLHKQLGPSIAEFYEAITETFKRGGNVIIPTFALERAQELLYFLSAGVTQGRLAKSTQVYLDSPMAISTTEIFRRHPECFEPATAKLFQGRSHFVPGSGREPLQQILKTQLTSRDGGSGQAGGPAYNGYRLNGTTLPRERCLPSLSAACTLMASSSPTNGFLIIRASLISSSAALST
jgi:hypothetical protein